jgi:hypothetical protein
MVKPPATPPPPKPPRALAAKADAGREARLAAALRSNLRRRKDAARRPAQKGAHE